ncbi:hypothetical protein ABZW75_25380, partial [Streptomyces sp. NPDC004589]
GAVPVQSAAQMAASLIGQGSVRMNPLNMASVVVQSPGHRVHASSGRSGACSGRWPTVSQVAFTAGDRTCRGGLFRTPVRHDVVCSNGSAVCKSGERTPGSRAFQVLAEYDTAMIRPD